MTFRSEPPAAVVVGTGLIGGSIGMALRRRGWRVTGRDSDPARSRRAVELGALDAVGDDPAAVLTFVATPAGAVIGEARRVLHPARQLHPARGGGKSLGTGGIVTDVAGVKGPIVAALAGESRFVGGHPMAGSEQEGVDGADAELFVGATWVLTPSEGTDPDAYAQVQAVITSFGAEPVAVSPRRHDDLVAMVSHVPHLAAAALMNLAADAASEDAALLRLAAGGFRDMTRVAAGHPGIWPDVVAENRAGIVAILDRFSSALAEIRRVVSDGDRAALLVLLESAREARISLPTGAPPVSEAAEVRVPVPDRPGVIAEITTLLGEIGVNIYDVEIAHSVEGDRGVLVLVVDAAAVGLVQKALVERRYRPSARALGR